MKQNNYILIAVIIIVSLVLIKAFNISYPVTITTKEAPANLAVTGEGKVDVIPDTATIQAGIVVTNTKTVEEAQKSIDEVHNKIVESVKKLGVDKKDIETSDYSINPNYSFENNTNKINGYNGNATLSIKVRKIEVLPQVISEVTKAGANQIYGTQYIVENPEKYREEARQKAIDNAKEQAQKLAKSLGINLGKVVNFVEAPVGPPPVPVTMKSVTEAAGTPNLQPGSQTVTSVVTLYFEKN